MEDTLAAQLRAICEMPLAVVGVGNSMRGDDGFGPAVVAALEPHQGLARFDAGMAPENWVGPVARANPRTILVLDATDLGEPPGTLRLFPADAVEGIGASTHGLPLGFFLHMVEERTGAHAWLLAAQPEGIRLGDALSEAMAAAVERAATVIRGLFSPPN